jgi:hypothetical protein
VGRIVVRVVSMLLFAGRLVVVVVTELCSSNRAIVVQVGGARGVPANDG